MSHLVTVAVEVRDQNALAAACRRLQLPEPQNQTVRFFDGSEVIGVSVRLPGWR